MIIQIYVALILYHIIHSYATQIILPVFSYSAHKKQSSHKRLQILHIFSYRYYNIKIRLTQQVVKSVRLL